MITHDEEPHIVRLIYNLVYNLARDLRTEFIEFGNVHAAFELTGRAMSVNDRLTLDNTEFNGWKKRYQYHQLLNNKHHCNKTSVGNSSRYTNNGFSVHSHKLSRNNNWHFGTNIGILSTTHSWLCTDSSTLLICISRDFCWKNVSMFVMRGTKRPV